MGRLIDLSLMTIVAYAAATLGIVALANGSPAPIIIYLIALGFFVLFGYPVGFEVYGGGRTPGHRATGTRVIRTDGGPIGLRHSAIRAMLFLVDGFATTGFAGAVSVLVTKRGQRLGDLAAGTMVIRLNRPVMAVGRPPTLSGGLRARAAEFDRRRLNADDVATARMLMERGAQLREGAQVDLATRMADRLDSQLGHVRLADDEAIDFIYAVLEADGPPSPDAPPTVAPSSQRDRTDVVSSYLASESDADRVQEPFAAPAGSFDVGGDEPAAEDAVTDDSAEPEENGFAPPT